MGEALLFNIDIAVPVLASDVYLYNLGDECADITGGWDEYNYLYEAGVSTRYALVNPTFHSSYVDFTLSNVSYKITGIVNLKGIDVTNYKKLCITYSTSNLFKGNYFGVAPNRTTAFTAYTTITTTGDNITAEVNISNITGEVVVGFNFNTAGSEANGGTIYLHKIWLEV